MLKAFLVLGLLAFPLSAQDRSLATRVQAIEDRAEIETLLINYGRFLDARRFADYAALFTTDGEWSGGFGNVKGRAAIQAFMEKAMPGENKTHTYHVLTNFLIEVKGDTATAWSHWAFITPTADAKPQMAQGGRYADKLVREGGHWKIQQRIVYNDIPFNDPTAKK